MQNCSCRAYYITVTLEASHGRNCQNLIFLFFFNTSQEKNGIQYNIRIDKHNRGNDYKIYDLTEDQVLNFKTNCATKMSLLVVVFL